ncbi:ribonuclease H-like protein [Nemania serpens]|nr:ribonuclease H-like protein [Nemania serpens]
MPLGWYLAQGFIPVVPYDSDDEEGPCRLPDGRLVCGPHGFVVCGRCCSDYSFMEDVLSHGEDEDEDDVLDAETEAMYRELGPEARAEIDSRWGPPQSPRSLFVGAHTVSTREPDAPAKRRGIGRVFPTRFIPSTSNATLTELFPGTATSRSLSRYIHRLDPRKVLILTDGACLNNGMPNPKSGWAFVHGPGLTGQPALIASGRLEYQGPFGDPSIQSSNRAELRAVIAALRFRDWTADGFNTVVIATDSEYVTAGSTAWARSWVRNGWRTAGKGDVKNKDLWEMLLGEVERLDEEGLSIQFWRISRDLNQVADAAAKKAAAEDELRDEWTDAGI